MKKRIPIILILISAIAICVVIFFVTSKKDYHKQLNVDDIQTAIAWSGFHNCEYQLKDEEVETLAAVFNNTQCNQANDDFEGITPSYGIRVTFSSAETMTINEAESSYGDVEVQRKIEGKLVSYWIDDDELEICMKKVCFPK